MTGIPASELSDDDLDRGLAHLEQEFLRRFPDRAAPDPHRVRASRQT